MKSFFHKILSVTLATLVLFTTMSFTLDMHYCGDTLVDFSLFDDLTTCGMETQVPTKACGNELTEKSCCSELQIVMEGQDDLKLTFDTLNLEQQAFVAAFFYSYINLFEGLDENIVPFRDYNPPFLIRDIQKLHETYLI
ncbi:HYC_CC_PP family protein [Gelidibacter maritimus]|uniref:Secreted protein n=1 Tax=Gelidibacter maritimus TaxID=2761487 RepID=A0A7W2M841_9FLAO|nr:hypothetical protein [Gelidibacter maritimus]MBA6154388.1 hypothetical protein [Gelidibacter maritimus]